MTTFTHRDGSIVTLTPTERRALARDYASSYGDYEAHLARASDRLATTGVSGLWPLAAWVAYAMEDTGRRAHLLTERD